MPPVRPLTPRRGELLLVSSSGGVVLDLFGLAPWWRGRPRRWVSVHASDTDELLADESVTWQPELSPRSALLLVRNVTGAVRSLRREPVAAVVSAGSGVAVPWFLAAFVCHVPRVWVETLNVVGRPGLASRVCARMASVVLVQHPHQVGRHRRALMVGELY